MKEELKKCESSRAYEIVEDLEQDRIEGPCIVNRKDAQDGLKVNVKARYCLRGFKEDGKPRSDSPTGDRLLTNILYAVTAQCPGWDLESINVTSVFLQEKIWIVNFM